MWKIFMSSVFTPNAFFKMLHSTPLYTHTHRAHAHIYGLTISLCFHLALAFSATFSQALALLVALCNNVCVSVLLCVLSNALKCSCVCERCKPTSDSNNSILPQEQHQQLQHPLTQFFYSLLLPHPIYKYFIRE